VGAALGGSGQEKANGEVDMDTSELGSTVRQLEERVESQVKDVSRRVQTATERIAEAVREHPAAALAGAFAVGYLLARVARRS
jgi:ElaB/YqjD/DUF883 family membrane-anchored ribosome-binding protein